MIRFALIAASTLGFFLTAALGNLMTPLLRAFRVQQEENEPPTMGGLCLMVGVLAAVGVGWTAACVAQPELLGAESLFSVRLLTALLGALLFGGVGLLEDLARIRSRSVLGLRRHTRLGLEAAAGAVVLVLLLAMMLQGAWNGGVPPVLAQAVGVVVTPVQRAAAFISDGVTSHLRRYLAADQLAQENQQLHDELRQLREQMVDYETGAPFTAHTTNPCGTTWASGRSTRTWSCCRRRWWPGTPIAGSARSPSTRGPWRGWSRWTR